MGNFYTDVILKSGYAKNPNEVCKDIAMLEPGFRARVQSFITDAGSAGKKLVVLETYRSQARQAHLYAQGRTAPGRIVTSLAKVGVHGYGLACDLGLMDPKYDPTGEHYAFFQALCAKHRMISGIDWGTPHQRHSFHDWDHVQGVPVFRQNDLFAGRWYPPQGYDPIQDQIDHHISGI
jgi:hypothetical protein